MNTKNILLTNLRSAVSLDLARAFSMQGHKVFGIDSFSNPLIKKTRYLAHTKQVRPPRQEFENYKKDVIDFVNENKIDVIVPVYEEVFWISKLKPDLPSHVFCFCDDFDQMNTLHNKSSFINLCESFNIQVPNTTEVSSLEEVQKSWDNSDRILKPVYSRFASNVFFSKDTSFKDLNSANIDISSSRPWVYQERIKGQEYCSYTLAHQGKVSGHMIYAHDFTAGKGAGISFKSVESKEILEWVVNFVQKTNYTGQICFDLIVNENGIYPLECNPRATSGLHLLSQLNEFPEMILNPREEITTLKEGHKAYLSKMAMVLYGLVQITNLKQAKSFFDHMLKGRNVLQHYTDENYVIRQLSTLLTLFKIARQTKVSLLEASTLDIEYNGIK